MDIAAFGDVTSTTAPQKTNWMDSVSNVITKVVQPAAQVYSQVKTNTGSQSQSPTSTANPWITQTDPNTPGAATPAAPAKDNTKTYVMIAGGVALAGTALYFILKGEKKSPKK